MKDLINFLDERFPDNAAARKYFVDIRWPNGVRCPHCNLDKVTESKNPNASQPYKCYPCNRNFSVKTKSFMHASPIKERTWLLMMFFMAKGQVSSTWLADTLSIKTQTTAWRMATRIRAACDQRLELLTGDCEADETYPDGKEGNKHAKDRRRAGRGVANKTPVVGIKQRNGKIVAKVLPNTKKHNIQGFIADHVAPGSRVFTDEHKSYTGLSKLGYEHHTVNHSKGEYVRGSAHTNGIESFWSTLKRSIKGVHTHVSKKYLPLYLNEMMLRENNDDFIEAVSQIGCAKMGVK